MSVETRGVKNNNPGNIRLSGTRWQGEVPGLDPAFVTFDTPEHGIRAIAKIFLAYHNRGIKTLGGIVSTWAPPNENDTLAYLADVSQRTGFAKDQVVDVTIPEVSGKIVTAIIHHENGYDPYEPDVIQRGVEMALS